MTCKWKVFCKQGNTCVAHEGYDIWKCTGFKKKPLTNFERVTASPEALAKWICEITDFCDSGCSRCPVQEKCLYDSDGAGNKDNEQLLIEFLKEKSNCGEK